MKRLGRKTEDKRAFVCPQCGKPRMIRPVNHKVSFEEKEYKISETETVKLMADVCDQCIARNSRLYFQPKPEDIKKLMKAMKEQKSIEGQSLEEML